MRTVRGDDFLTIGIEDCDPWYSALTALTQSCGDRSAILHFLDINLQENIVMFKQFSIRIEELLENLAPTSPHGTKVDHDTFVLRFCIDKSRVQ